MRASVRSKNRSEYLYTLMERHGADTSRLTHVVIDLNSPKGWADAVAGVEVGIHMASPLGGDNQQDPKLIETAKNGVRHVLQAALDAGIPKVVLTSSMAAATPPKKTVNHYVDENFWTNPLSKEINNYRRSKVFAEQLAWEMVADQTRTQLTTILPGSVFGPALDNSSISSAEIIKLTLQGQIPVMNVTYEVVDVRDVADLHILAMEAPEANGERFLAVIGPLTTRAIAQLLKEEMGDVGKKILQIHLPNAVPRVVALFVPQIRTLVPMLSRQFLHTNKKAKSILGWNPRSPRECVVDTAESLF